ncbi:MAG: site-specific integrase [candidate division Zixibacteria bacterium]|nr:site-specific integrase [candidate division Zixibacteria bacterium]
MRTQEVVASFMADCKLRGLSPKTLRGYDCHTKRLIELSPEFPPKSDTIQEFLATVKGAHNADAYYRTYHALGNYAERRCGIPNFMQSVTRPRVPKQIMPTISNTELNLLAVFLEKAPARDKAILVLFIDTAIRSGEAALKRKDIGEDRIIIHGKTGYRVAPLSSITRDLLLSLPVYEDGYVFHGTGKYKDIPLGSTGFYKIVKKYLRMVGYQGGKQYGPQTLRRSFGVFHLKDGGDLKSLSLILGHSSITTTANYYTPLLTEDVIQIHHKHSPIKVFEEATNESNT